MVGIRTQFKADMMRFHGISFARIGMMVEVKGEIGTIAGMSRKGNLNVVFANQLKHGVAVWDCCPTRFIKYFGADGKMIADYTGQFPGRVTDV
ncbi:hypothetical protein [Pantoea sp. BAV 3049]|uniref:hypothetical protein n=1 Tax=Pantoea sp. BAV 3049 TaxID=2654188 RepID=UPI00131E0878|nr:hypothetical protein [Pantoea sp. BAV 3049]